MNQQLESIIDDDRPLKAANKSVRISGTETSGRHSIGPTLNAGQRWQPATDAILWLRWMPVIAISLPPIHTEFVATDIRDFVGLAMPIYVYTCAPVFDDPKLKATSAVSHSRYSIIAPEPTGRATKSHAQNQSKATLASTFASFPIRYLFISIFCAESMDRAGFHSSNSTFHSVTLHPLSN